VSKVRRSFALVLALVLVLALGSVALAQTAPKVTVSDQEIVDGTVTIQSVDAAQDGWVVIHAQANGNPGPDLGHAAVTAGNNTNVVVTIDVSRATPVLYAMLHIDAGAAGTYEFPGADVPAAGEQADVNPTFNVTNLAAVQAVTSAPAAPAPAPLPTTGGSGANPTAAAGLILGLVFLAAGFRLSQRRMSR
jgi:LPXTG-motif cell wall-anchored protein